jgi:tripartite-type tricarboxylate transporter receptor subunit TctC
MASATIIVKYGRNTMHRVVAAISGVWMFIVSSATWAQGGYPSKSIRLVVPSAPGGGTDIIARLIAQG